MVKNSVISIRKNVRHTPQPSAPILPDLLIKIIKIASSLKEGPTLVCAFVVLFHTFLRQSNIAAKSSKLFDPTRNLTRGDIALHSHHVVITHKWSKTHQFAGPSRVINIPAIKGSILCPLRAITLMFEYIPTLTLQDPFLMFRERNHIPLSYLNRVWNQLITSLDLPPAKYTLHGLRRGAATHLYQYDPALKPHIKAHGMWRSDAVDLYIPTSQKIICDAMTSSITRLAP